MVEVAGWDFTAKIDLAISSPHTMTMDIAQTFIDSAGNVQNIDSVAGGGVTQGNANTPGNTNIVISGNIVNGSHPDTILTHEIVGHALPSMGHSDTGNAVDNTNKVRAEMGESLRPADPNHVEK